MFKDKKLLMPKSVPTLRRVAHEDEPLDLSASQYQDDNPRSNENRLLIDMQRLETDLNPKNKLDEIADNMLALTFGDKVEMSDGIAEILRRTLGEDGKPVDGFVVAMSMHKWARLRTEGPPLEEPKPD